MDILELLCCLYLSRFHEIAQKSKDDLVELGFPSFTIEDFHETVSISIAGGVIE